MSIRSQWCEYDKETRKYIKKRDGNKCYICGAKGGLQIMHIFVNRSHGGKGCKENGCLGCIKCHRIIDNPIGEQENKLSKQYLEYCKNYLIEKENINYNDDFIENLKYHKKYGILDLKIERKEPINRCKNCKYLIKKSGYNTTLPSYYCKYKKIYINKTTKACKKYSS